LVAFLHSGPKKLQQKAIFGFKFLSLVQEIKIKGLIISYGGLKLGKNNFQLRNQHGQKTLHNYFQQKLREKYFSLHCFLHKRGKTGCRG